MRVRAVLRTAVRWLLYAVLAVVCFLLQGSVFSRLPILGAAPLILPVAAVGVALWEGADRGALFGLCCGILCDAALGRPAVMYTLLLTAAGLGVGILADRLLRRGWIACLACTLGVLGVCILLQAAGLVFLYRAPMEALALGGAVQLGYSLLFVLPIYPVCRAAGGLFKDKEKVQP